MQSVALAHVLDVLTPPQADKDKTPLWEAKTETAGRLRGRVESVLNWASVHGYRDGLNPARWKGHLDAILKAPNKIQKAEHHKAIPYAEMPPFMKALPQQESMGARALEFAILYAARSGEVRGATWDEIDVKKGVWTVPGERMKAGTDLVFPSPRGKVLSDMTLTAVMRRLQLEAVPHGFRSSLPASMRREDLDALKAQHARMKGDCKGHSSAIRAAMAWLVTANALHMRASQLATWADAQLWEGAKVAHKASPQALHTLPDSILQSIAWGEAVSLMWGLRKQTANLPVGPDSDPYAIINSASPGFGAAIAGLVHKVKLSPLDDLQWRQHSSTEAPYKPTFKNWLCLPWLPEIRSRRSQHLQD